MILLRVLKPLPGRRAGEVVRVEADENGTPLSREWRRRLRDAKTDGCVEVVREVRETAPSAPPPRVAKKGGPPAAEKE